MSAIDILNDLVTLDTNFKNDLKSKFQPIIEGLLNEHGSRYVLFEGLTPHYNPDGNYNHRSIAYLEWNDECGTKLYDFDWYTPTEMVDAQELSWTDPKLEIIKEHTKSLGELLEHSMIKDMLVLLYKSNFHVLCGFDDAGVFQCECQEFVNHE